MAGVIPPTKLLLVRNNLVIGNFNSYTDVALYLGIRVTDNGEVIFMNNSVNPKYCLDPDEASHVGNEWRSKLDVIKDWAVYHMGCNLPKEYTIYRYLCV